MSVSRSLHAYRMDRIWLKAPKAEKVRRPSAHGIWSVIAQQLYQWTYQRYIIGAVWLACVHWQYIYKYTATKLQVL